MPPLIGVWLSVAWADPPAARMCADAVAGRELEVCLQVLSEHPEALAEVTAALVAHLDAQAEPDRELLAGLLLLSGAQGVVGVERLAALGDARAVPVLLYAVRHREQDVATAAARSLAAWPALWAELGRVLADDALPESVRLGAAEGLAATGDPRAAAMVEQAMRRPGVSRLEHRQVAGLLAERFPARPVPVRRPTREAAAWLSVGAGIGLGYAMAAVGSFGSEELWPLAAATGVGTGASVGWITGKAWPMEAGEGALITVGGLSGGGAGALFGAALAPDSVEGPLVGGVVGEAVGFTTAALLRRRFAGTSGDVVEAAGLAGLGTVAVHGLASFRAAPASTRSAADGAALALGLGAGLALAPVLEVEAQDAGLIATTAATGLAIAAVVPVGARDRRDLLIAAPAGGAAVGLMLSNVVDLGADVWVVGWTGAAAGAALGGGTGWMLDAGLPARNLLAAAGGGLGFGAGAALAHLQPDPVDDRDVWLVATTAAWAAAQAAAIGYAGDGVLEDREIGGVMAAAGLATAVTATLSPRLDIPTAHTLSASSVGLWGAYAGGALGEIGWEAPAWGALVGTNVGLVSGGLLVSDLVGTPPLVIATANAGGVVGASVAGLVAGGITRDPRGVLGASLGGAAAGAVVGGSVGRAWHRSGGRRDIAWRGIGRLPGRWTVVPRVDGVTLVVDRW